MAGIEVRGAVIGLNEQVLELHVQLWGRYWSFQGGY